MRTPRLLFAVVGLLAALALPDARAQDPPADPNVEVLTRGPVHEAYANAVSSQPAPGLFAPKQPPEPIEELPPDEKAGRGQRPVGSRLLVVGRGQG